MNRMSWCAIKGERVLRIFTILTFACIITVLSPRVSLAQTLLRTITVTPAPACTPLVSVGIAFDGSELLVSCIYNFTVTRVNPATGAVLGSYLISGMLPVDGGIGAMSWDADVGQLWVGSSQTVPQHIYKILLNKTTSTGVATLAFTHTAGGLSIIDGIAYDGTDPLLKFVWLSPDVSDTIYKYSVAGGAPIFSHSGLTAALGGSGNSGVAVANATVLYLANDGGASVYSWNNAFTGAPALFVSDPPNRKEDLECDNVSFTPGGALWTKDAYDWILRAYSVPAGQCAQGGVVKPPPMCVCEMNGEDDGHGEVADENGGNGGEFNDNECDNNHELEHNDPNHNMMFKASTHGLVSFFNGQAVTEGQGAANGQPVKYVLVQTGGPAGNNFYSITLSDASGVIYQRSGKLISGQINVAPPH